MFHETAFKSSPVVFATCVTTDLLFVDYVPFSPYLQLFHHLVSCACAALHAHIEVELVAFFRTPPFYTPPAAMNSCHLGYFSVLLPP
jgi:hypothetical protein